MAGELRPERRAGFIAAPVNGPPMSTSFVIVSPIARPAIALNAPRGSTAVAQTETRKKVRISSNRNALPSSTAAVVARCRAAAPFREDSAG